MILVVVVFIETHNNNYSYKRSAFWSTPAPEIEGTSKTGGPLSSKTEALSRVL
jgi:hypothetical protein